MDKKDEHKKVNTFPITGSIEKVKSDQRSVETSRQTMEDYMSHLASIVETSDDAIISKSLAGIIKSWNTGSEKMFGYSHEEAIGKHISIIIPDEYLDEEKNIFERMKNGETINHYETIRCKKDHSQLHVSISASPLKDHTGNIVAISKIVRDISLKKKLEAEYILANKELVFQNTEMEKRTAELLIANTELALQHKEKEKLTIELVIANKELAIQSADKVARATQLESVNKELEAFSYSVSHDLRAPLRSIYGYTLILKESLEKSDDLETDRLINNIMGGAKKMGQLIDDLLTFSRLGRKEVVKMKVPLNEMVLNLCEEFKKEHPNRNIQFCINDLLPAQGDSVTLKQVWVNLISNAIKYTGLKDKAIIEIDSSEQGEEVIYSIKDNGAGFDIRYANKLFGVFQRLHSDDEFEGTGVGLAIVHRIITRHGGRVWAESKLNDGATFFFTLNKSS